MTVADKGQPIVFLDSSALTFLFHFWEACAGVNADDQLDENSNWENLSTTLQSAGVDTSGLTQSNSINGGMLAFEVLHNHKCSHQFLTSLSCRAQMHHTLLEARGMEELVRRRVPRNLRMERSQMLYQAVLKQEDYDELRNQTEAFRNTLNDDYGIEVLDLDDPTRGLGITHIDIWTVAQELWSHVLLDMTDGYAYAAAICVKADVFLSSDSDLRKALKHLSDPGSDWATTATALKQSIGLSPDASLPRPHTPRTAANAGFSAP